MLADAAEVYQTGFRAGIRPDPAHTISSWADAHRMLSQKASSEPGRWRTERTPYMREIMDTLSPSHPAKRVAFMKGAQVGGSEAGNNFLGFVIHHAPGPVMMVQSTVDTAKKYSKQRLAPMIEETPVLKERIASNDSRDTSNTMMMKDFPGGVLILTGANSAAGLRSMPIRYLFLDEVDSYPHDVDGEGDPIMLAEKRTTTFARRKILLVSTPTVKDESRIEREFSASDRRYYFVPCPQCGEFQNLKFPNLKWSDDDPATAFYQCEHCGGVIEERHKATMLPRGEWRATAISTSGTVGFHLNSLYSPLGWKSWAEIVQEFLAAKHDKDLLKTFVNTVLGETFDDEQATRLGADDLQKRVEFYKAGQAPADVLAVTIGVDVQDNRVAVSRWGWGRGEQGWLIDHQELFGDPSTDEFWLQVEQAVAAAVPHESGRDLQPAAICVDSGGHFTNEVYAFARSRKAKIRNLVAIKGSSQRNKPVIGKPTPVDFNWKKQTFKKGAEVYPVGTDTAKDTLFRRLANKPEAAQGGGTGHLHFHAEAGAEYFEQLTAERKATRYHKGFPVREYVKKSGARNEALDCLVYAYAGLHFLYTKHHRATMWDTLQKQISGTPAAAKVTEKPAPDSAKLAQNRRVQAPKRGGNFMTNW